MICSVHVVLNCPRIVLYLRSDGTGPTEVRRIRPKPSCYRTDGITDLLRTQTSTAGRYSSLLGNPNLPNALSPFPAKSSIPPFIIVTCRRRRDDLNFWFSSLTHSLPKAGGRFPIDDEHNRNGMLPTKRGLGPPMKVGEQSTDTGTVIDQAFALRPK